MREISKVVLKQLGTEGKSLCKYLVHKLPCLKVTIQSSAAKYVGVEEFSSAPDC